MYFYIGAVFGIFLLSKSAELIVFRKISPPKKQIFSTMLAFVLASTIGAYGLADEGEPKFFQSTFDYGVASIIWLAIQMTIFFKNRVPRTGTEEWLRMPDRGSRCDEMTEEKRRTKANELYK